MDQGQARLPITEKRERRGAFMQRLYEVTDGNRLARVNFRTIGSHFGWDEQETYAVAQYLVDEYLAEWAAMGGLIAITHAGVVEVEQLLMAPDEPTVHFEPVTHVTVTVHGDNLGQIQAGSHHSTQWIQESGNDEILRRFVEAFREALSSEGHPVENRQLIEINLGLIESEIDQGRSGSTLVQRLLPPLRDFAISLAASGAYEGLHAAIAALPPL